MRLHSLVQINDVFFRFIDDIKWKFSARHLKFDEDIGYNETLELTAWDLVRGWVENET
jgi:hypothetical protein